MLLGGTLPHYEASWQHRRGFQVQDTHQPVLPPSRQRHTALKIWDIKPGCLEGTEKEHAQAQQQPALAIAAKGIKQFAKRHYRTNEDGKGRCNRRQIRNAFPIAGALARFEKNQRRQRDGAVGQGYSSPWLGDALEFIHGQPPQRGVSHGHVDEDTDDDSDDS
ncbi:hypothetical protein BJY00DRAFT_308455 [Aspergillus carlsbadensis]|nr:hypothetical protein BJY00DRAFT_308455 [Aspergillus carlsbadensis]